MAGAQHSQKDAADRGMEATPPDGPTKAALWLLSVGEEVAVQVLGQLEDGEIVQLRERMAAVHRCTPAQITAIQQEFQTLVSRPILAPQSGQVYLRRLMAKAKGEESAQRLLTAPVSPAEPTAPTDAIGLALALATERPQVAAVCLARTKPELAAEVLQQFSEEHRLEVLSRLAGLDSVPTEAAAQLDRALRGHVQVQAGPQTEVDGVRAAALLLNEVAPDVAQQMLDVLAKANGDLATGIRRAMFTFEDVAKLDRKGLQALLKETPSDQLLLALRAAGQDLRAKVFGAMSKRAAAMMQDDLEVMAPARLSEVEKAQQAVVDVALQMRADGRLTVAGHGGDELV